MFRFLQAVCMQRNVITVSLDPIKKNYIHPFISFTYKCKTNKKKKTTVCTFIQYNMGFKMCLKMNLRAGSSQYHCSTQSCCHMNNLK